MTGSSVTRLALVCLAGGGSFFVHGSRLSTLARLGWHMEYRVGCICSLPPYVVNHNLQFRMVGSRNEDRFFRKICRFENDPGGGRLACNSIFGKGCFHRYSVVAVRELEGTVGNVHATNLLGRGNRPVPQRSSAPHELLDRPIYSCCLV